MKAQKLLLVLLMSMLIACFPGNAFAISQTVTAGFNEGQEQHVTVNDNVNVSNETNAVFVEAHAPDEAEDKTASAIVNGNVTLTNSNDISVVYVEGRNGDASAKITGNITGTSDGSVNGIETWGHSFNGNGDVYVTAGGNVSVESKLSNASGITSDYASVNVTEDVTAKGKYVYGVESYNDNKLTIGGNVRSEGEISTGMCAYSDKKTEIDVKGGVDSTGNYAKGLQIESYPGCDLSVAVANGILAAAAETDPEGGHGVVGISFHNDGGKLAADINGDVESKAANGGAIGIQTDQDGGETGRQFADGSSEILVHGNVISDGIGVTLDTFGENTDVNVLVENEILAKKVGVSIGRTWFAEEDSDTEPELTVWKIGLNTNGKVVEWGDFGFNDPYDDEYKAKAIADFEKHIMYIAKVEQPSKGGTLKVVDADGKALPTSYGFPVAHEGKKVILKANLQSGWKIKAAYNGDGANKQKLSKDENGDYYIIVPKGGGVYLSADLEKKTTPVKPSQKKVSGVLIAKMLTNGDTGVTITWNKVKGVKGYDVFFCRCDGKEDNSALKKVATVKAGKKRTWSKTGLKQHRAYKAIVKAYVYKKGKKKYVRTSPLVHAYSSGSTKRYTNASGVTVNKTELTLNKKGTFQIKGKAVKSNKKKIMNTGHSPYLRYLSSNKKIATVSKSGKITAKAIGACYVYTLTHNGLSKKIKVTVK